MTIGVAVRGSDTVWIATDTLSVIDGCWVYSGLKVALRGRWAFATCGEAIIRRAFAECPEGDTVTGWADSAVAWLKSRERLVNGAMDGSVIASDGANVWLVAADAVAVPVASAAHGAGDTFALGALEALDCAETECDVKFSGRFRVVAAVRAALARCPQTGGGVAVIRFNRDAGQWENGA